MTTTPHNAAVGYVRLSKLDTTGDNLSLDMQRQRVTDYCKLHGMELVFIASDSDVSGAVPLGERPGGEKLYNGLTNGKAVNVVALKLDRLFRDACDALNTVRDWDQRGVALHLIDMGGMAVNTRSAMGRMFLTMMAAFAELERNMIADRTRAVLAEKRARNEKLGGAHPPFGFRVSEKIGDNGQPVKILVPDVEAQQVCRRILAERRSGRTMFEIACQLNKEGLLTAGGKRWQPKAIQRAALAAERLG